MGSQGGPLDSRGSQGLELPSRPPAELAEPGADCINQLKYILAIRSNTCKHKNSNNLSKTKTFKH